MSIELAFVSLDECDALGQVPGKDALPAEWPAGLSILDLPVENHALRRTARGEKFRLDR